MRFCVSGIYRLRTALLTLASTIVAATSVVADPLIDTAGGEDLIVLRADYQRPTEIPFPDDNPFSEAKARFGKILYFDPRLSRSNMQSCASCHNLGFAWGDGLAVGVGDRMTELGRRSPTILNAAWSEVLMWDGRFETLEEQALNSIEMAVEMNMLSKHQASALSIAVVPTCMTDRYRHWNASWTTTTRVACSDQVCPMT